MCSEILLKVIKNIFCMDKYQENCKKCSLCHLIDKNNLPSLKIIESDGNLIKKDQIISLRDTFARESLYTKESIYVIKNAEKMNKEAANTILKFLEEPEGSVIGFFITNNKENILPTIQSRCQYIEANFITNLCDNLNITNQEFEEMFEIVKEYIYKIEVERKELILYNKIYLNDYDRNQITTFLKIVLDIYKSQLENKDLYSDFKYLNELTLKNIIAKINLIIKILKEINYNVNLELILDKFIIEMDAINNANL